MFKTIILVCAMSVAPPDCQNETALDIISGPLAANELMCGLHGQAYIAGTGYMERHPGEYIKIKCTRMAPPAKVAAKAPPLR